MKTFIINSFKLFRTLHPSSYILSSVNQIPLYGFATTKSAKQSSTIKQTKLTSKPQSNEPIQPPLSLQQRQRHILTATRQQLEHKSLHLIKSYITIDQIKCQPGAIRLLLITFIKTLQYDPTNRGRIFYLNNKQCIQKIFYDLRSYNAQSEMSSSDILLTYYLYKLLKDYGYSIPPTGFELRSGIKLAKHVPIRQNTAQGLDTLSLDQVVHARWLMAVTGNSNHEFKWNCHVMMVEMLGSWKNVNPYDHATYTQTSFSQLPIKFHHICTVLSSFYHQQIHLLTDYKSVQFMIKLLFVNAQNYINYDKLLANENIFLEAFACLMGLGVHFFSGHNVHEIKNVIGQIAAVVERRLMGWVVGDQQIKGMFMKSSSLEMFLKSDSYEKYKNFTKSMTQTNKQMQNFTDQDLYRYFVLLNEIHQNKSFFDILAPSNYQKLMFILNQIFEQYFASHISNKGHVINSKILSIYARYKLIMFEKQLNKLQKHKNGQKKGQEKFQQQVEDILKGFQHLIQTIAEKSKFLNLQIPSSKKLYLTAQEKQITKQKQLQMKKIQRNIINPIIDFLYAMRNYISASQLKILQPSRVTTILTHFQSLLTQLFSDIPYPFTLSIKKKYFWLLKFLRLAYTTTTDNKIYLKQFELLLLQHIVKNNQKPQPENYQIVSVYNLYAYMCQVQERMIENERTGEGVKGQDEERKGFYEKKEYKYFLAYKEYLAKLIFQKNFDYEQIQKQQSTEVKIPNKLRIDSLFTRTHNPQPTLPSFNISQFFHIIFRQNRFSNHKLLSQQFLNHIFGNQQLFNQNFTQYIQKKNQRSGENFTQIIYMILLAGDRQVGGGLRNGWDLGMIKRRLFQALTEKSVGNLVINVMRDVAAPRKTSFFKRNPLKYRLNPYSLFETVKYDSLKCKKQVLTSLLQLYYPSKSISFGFLEILLHNLDLWNPQEKSQIIWGVIMPAALHRIKQGQAPESAFDVYINLAIRLPRRCQVEIYPEHQHVFLQVLSSHLPQAFQKISRATKQKRKFTDVNGYLLDLEIIYNQNSLDFKNLTSILQKCRQNMLKNDSDSKDSANYRDNKSYNMLLGALQRLLYISRSSKKAFGSSSQKAQSKQSQKATSTGKLFNGLSQKQINSSGQKKQSVEKIGRNLEKQYSSSQKSPSKLFKVSSKKLVVPVVPEVQKIQKVKRGIFSKKE